MTKSTRPHSSKRVPINCDMRVTPNLNTILLGEVGYTSKDMPSIFLWCKACHKAHACNLDQLFKAFREISTQNDVARLTYLSILNEAILELQKEIAAKEHGETA